MKRSALPLLLAGVLVLTACEAGESPGESAPEGSGPAASADGTEGGGQPIDASGTVIFSGWQASPDEGELLEQMIADFEGEYPDVTVDYQPVSGDYAQQRIADFSAGTPPDAFYVDSSLAPE